MPTAAHFIYIPVMLMIGVVLGYVMGVRAARESFVLEQKRKEAREARRREREKATADQGGEEQK